MTSRILNRFNIETDKLLRSLATDKLSCDIHPRNMIKMVKSVSRDHIIIVIISPNAVLCDIYLIIVLASPSPRRTPVNPDGMIIICRPT